MKDRDFINVGLDKNIGSYNFDAEIKSISRAIRKNELDGLGQRLDIAYKYAYDCENNKQIGNALFEKGRLSRVNNEHQESIVNFREALTIFKLIGDKNKILNTYNNLGLMYIMLGAGSEALESFFYALELANEENQFSITKIGVLNNIGNIYYEWEDYDNALLIYFEAYELLDKEGVSNLIPLLAFNISTAYFFQGKFDLAYKYNEISTEIINGHDEEIELISVEIIDDMLKYEKNRDYGTFEKKYLKHMNRLKEICPFDEYIVLPEFVGRALYTINEYEHALVILEELYTELTHNEHYNKADGIRNILVKIYIHNENYKAAYLIKEDVKEERLYYYDKAERVQVFKNYETMKEEGYVWKLENLLWVFKLLAKIGEGIISDNDIKGIFDYISNHIYEIWTLDLFGLALIQNDGSTIDYYFHSSDSETKIDLISVENHKKIMSQCVILTKEIIIHNTRYKHNYESILPSELVELIEQSEINSFVFLPLFSKDKTIGGITIQSKVPDFFARQDLEVLNTLASYCSVAVNNHIKQEMLIKMRDIDGLTGALNRHALIIKKNEIDNDIRTRQLPMMVAMLDVDYFKTYNDNYGHLEGDQCLIDIVQSLTEQLEGRNSMLYRYGGDEFVIMSEDITYHEADKLIHNIIQSIKRLKIKHEYQKSSDIVTISLGAVVIEEFTRASNEYLIEVDKLLYEVKEKARNGYILKNQEEKM